MNVVELERSGFYYRNRNIYPSFLVYAINEYRYHSSRFLNLLLRRGTELGVLAIVLLRYLYTAPRASSIHANAINERRFCARIV